jgi:hypothetical protein
LARTPSPPIITARRFLSAEYCVRKEEYA